MKKALITPFAPAAIGPYSQAIQMGQTVYFSGQIPLDPLTMEMVRGDFQAEASQVFKNLQNLITACGGTFNDIVKLTVYLIDLAHIETVNNVLTHYVKPPFPARTTIQVVALPKKAQIEIDAIMVMT